MYEIITCSHGCYLYTMLNSMVNLTAMGCYLQHSTVIKGTAMYCTLQVAYLLMSPLYYSNRDMVINNTKEKKIFVEFIRWLD